MTRHVIAWYVGGVDTVTPFKRNEMYSLTIKKSWWSKKITVYHRDYSDGLMPGTLHAFDNRSSFDNCWQIIKEVK